MSVESARAESRANARRASCRRRFRMHPLFGEREDGPSRKTAPVLAVVLGDANRRLPGRRGDRRRTSPRTQGEGVLSPRTPAGGAARLGGGEPVAAVRAHPLDDRHERLALVRQRVLHPRRDLGEGLPLDDSLLLERAQAQRERAGRDALERALQLAEARAAVGEVTDQEDRPLAAEDLGTCADWTTLHHFRKCSTAASATQRAHEPAATAATERRAYPALARLDQHPPGSLECDLEGLAGAAADQRLDVDVRLERRADTG